MSRRAGQASNVHAHESSGQLPPFLSKTYDLVSDPSTNPVISWSEDGTSFVVWRHEEFSRNLLPQYFKHNNFSSFVRQLNTYGFRKVDAERWEFSQEQFIRGRKDLLANIHRRRPAGGGHQSQNQQPQSAIEVGQFGGLADEVDALKRDKNVLMVELVRLRRQQETSDSHMRMLQTRLEVQEQRQGQMMQFLSKALQHPGMLQQLVNSRQNIQRIANSGNSTHHGRKKLRKRAARDDSSVNSGGQDPGNQIVQYQGTTGAGSSTTPDFLAALMGDGGAFGEHGADSGDSAGAANGPGGTNVMEVNSALHSMSLERPLPEVGPTWPSNVTIAEHAPASAAMPAIPSQHAAPGMVPQQAAATSVPRVSSTPMASSPAASNGAASGPGADPADLPPMSMPMSAGGGIASGGNLPNLSQLPNGFSGMEGVTGLGDISTPEMDAMFGVSPGAPLPIPDTTAPLRGAAADGASPLPELPGEYSINDFNFDLLNSGSSISNSDAPILPADDTLTNSDAALWQQFMNNEATS